MKKIFKDRIYSILNDTEEKPAFLIVPNKKPGLIDKNNQQYTSFTQIYQDRISLRNKFSEAYPSKNENTKESLTIDIDNFKNNRDLYKHSSPKLPGSPKQTVIKPIMAKVHQTLNEIRPPIKKCSQMNNNSPKVLNSQRLKDSNFINYGWPITPNQISKPKTSNILSIIEQVITKESNGKYGSPANKKSILDRNILNALKKLSPKERRRAEEADELRSFEKFDIRSKQNDKTHAVIMNNNANINLRLL